MMETSFSTRLASNSGRQLCTKGNRIENFPRDLFVPLSIPRNQRAIFWMEGAIPV